MTDAAIGDEGASSPLSRHSRPLRITVPPMNAPRGMPLLSGPPPPPSDTGRAEIACRKCNKEFNIIFTRSRHCNHCGYSYCHSCSDYQALMPRETRSGGNAGYDVVQVCSFCIEFLNSAHRPPTHRPRRPPLAKLKRYVTAYALRGAHSAVEKRDLVDLMVSARGQNGCLGLENERYYRRHSVPKHADSGRPRGLFSTRPEPPTVAPPPVARSTRPEFARPDLAPDEPQQTRRDEPRYAPPPGPPPPRQTRPDARYAPPPGSPPQQTRPSPSGPSRPAQSPPHSRPQASRPPPPQSRPQPPSRPPPPQSTRPPQIPLTRPSPPQASRPPQPAPDLPTLLSMSDADIARLGIGALKEVLRTAHVPTGQALEKSDLVARVKVFVREERAAELDRHQREAEELRRERAAQQDRVDRAMEQSRRELEELDRQEEFRREREWEEGCRMQAEREREEQERWEADEEGRRERQSEEFEEDKPPEVVRAASPPADSAANPSQTNAHASTMDDARTFATDDARAPSPPNTPSATAKPSATTKLPPHQSHAERSGLCVVCQDEDAVLAIVDCG
ncbi:hypothetical protein BD626DRAFT_570254 [Schizophyllum amplum]|uniref:FYVE-type domain-containing protein n=1 Tax=Schizophyllum amplum TaxID=97359 RepID=A0A550CB60_9AGAR|nr:hypothetical protein BD626DRAFT_570254 [Auriculariopsis ampla]